MSDDTRNGSAAPCPDGGETGTATEVAAAVGLVSSRTIRQVGGVARREYHVLSRARWPHGLAALFAVFSLSVVALGGSSAGPSNVGALVVTLGELAVYLVPLAALALGYGTVVGAAERGTLGQLLAVPLRREAILAGMFLGRAATYAVGVSLGLAAGGVAIVLRYGVAVLPAYLHFLVTAVSVGCAFLAVGVCVSAATADTARALGGALLAWVWFVLVYDLVALGVLVWFDVPRWALSLLVVGNPADVLRLVVLSLVPASGGGVSAVLATTSVSAPVVVAALVGWVVGSVALGGRLLARRS